MIYALVKNGKVSNYPYSFRQLRKDNPDVSFPENPTDEKLTTWDVYPVMPITKPAPQSDAFNVEEGTPVIINGEWVQTWHEVPATPEQKTRREAEAFIKADTFITNFKAKKPKEIKGLIDNQVTDLASAKVVITKLALMVNHLLNSRLF